MEQELEIIWRKLHDPLRAFILSKIKSDADVDDLVQDTFIKIKTNLDKLKDPSKLTSWVYQIARNTINDFFRKNKRLVTEKETIEKERIEIDDENYDELLIKTQTEEFSQYAAFLINKLPEKYRDAVYLSDIKGINQKEIAKKLNLSLSGAKSRVQRGRQQIKEMVLKCCEVNADVYGNVVDFKPRPKCGGNC